MSTPHGIDEIIATFGDITSYIGPDGTLAPSWQSDQLDHSPLPFSLPLDWNRAVTVEKILCHKLMVPVFEQVFQQIVDRGLQAKVLTYGGCFTYRAQRASAKLSTHAWGIAIDLNPSSNQQGTAGDMDTGVIQVFKEAGFEWGGEWPMPRTDPMHFQFATGY